MPVLICITGSNSGSVVGVALYGEGFLALTSSDTVAAVNDTYTGTAARVTASWIYFGSHHQGTNKPRETVFSLEFKGTHTVPVVTMMAHAIAVVATMQPRAGILGLVVMDSFPD